MEVFENLEEFYVMFFILEVSFVCLLHHVLAWCDLNLPETVSESLDCLCLSWKEISVLLPYKNVPQIVLRSVA